MMKRISYLIIILITLPIVSHAQDFTGEIHSLHSVLDQLYVEMLPLCSQLIDVGRGLAGFAALWYISARVWRHFANAESIDFYPLLRPFGLGLAIMLFPQVMAVMNGVLKPTVTGTAALVSNSNAAIAYLLKQKEEAIQKTVTWQIYGDEGTHGKWNRYTNPEGEEESGFELLSNGIKFAMAKAAYGIKNAIKHWMSEVLHILFEAASLCINTVRTFQLIVLSILGPLVLGLSVLDGLHTTLAIWIARYINVFLWLPVANIFGAIISKIQENMLRIDISQIERYGDTFFSSADTAYIIFLIMGIIGYFTVPSVANFIVHAGGGNMLHHKTSNLFTGTASSTTSTLASGAGTLGKRIISGLGDSSSSKGNDSSNHNHKRLSGN